MGGEPVVEVGGVLDHAGPGQQDVLASVGVITDQTLQDSVSHSVMLLAVTVHPGRVPGRGEVLDVEHVRHLLVLLRGELPAAVVQHRRRSSELRHPLETESIDDRGGLLVLNEHALCEATPHVDEIADVLVPPMLQIHGHLLVES